MNGIGFLLPLNIYTPFLFLLRADRNIGGNSVQMMGYSHSRVFVALVLLSMLIAVCMAAPPAAPSQDVDNTEFSASDDYPFFEEDTLGMTDDGSDGPHEEKRAVFRMGKRAMMRFGKRAVMRFGKRSVFRLG
ncbi:unnamed protein product [Caenorhabditis brenneri]